MQILRDKVLGGRTVVTNATGELRDQLRALGAEIGEIDTLDATVEALVYDARETFDRGGPAALLGSLESMWEAIASVANASLIASGRGGKIVLIAPEDAAGEHAQAARAAVENLARTLSTEWARYSITTTALTPRTGTGADDLAVLAGFLLSEAGDYYSGVRFELGPR